MLPFGVAFLSLFDGNPPERKLESLQRAEVPPVNLETLSVQWSITLSIPEYKTAAGKLRILTKDLREVSFTMRRGTQVNAIEMAEPSAQRFLGPRKCRAEIAAFEFIAGLHTQNIRIS